MILKKSVSLLLVVMMSLSVLTVPVYAEQESSFLITSFDELEDDVETQYITDEDQFSDLVLPQELTAMGYTMLGGEDQSSIDLEEEPHEITFYEVDWKLKDKEQSESVRNSSSSQNTYVFAPVLTGSCILAEGVELPEVTAVTSVAQPMMMSLMSTLAAGPFVVPNSAPELANHLLAENSDITISGSVSYTGVLSATSMFDSLNLGTMSNTIFSLPPGILVTSGDGTPPETNTSSSYGVKSGGPSDSDVEYHAGVKSSQDSFSLKFDFEVPEGIPAVRFMFMFGSDEYPEYLDKVVDGAAIIVDDVNYAKFENGVQLKVVSDAELNANSGLAIEYDGISAPKVINALLDKTRAKHTLKIVIADTSDTAYDSGLFISAMKTSTSEVGGIIARNDASLISVAGKNDSTPGGQTGANPENSIIWDINVPDSQTAIDIGDIQVAPEASFELYSDPQFTLRLTGDESISLIQGDIVPAYVKVTAIDGVTEKFYSVNIRRDLGTIDLSDIIVTPYSGEYDGENHSIAVVDTNGGTVTYSTSETGEYTIDNPAYKNVGSYTVYYKVDRGAGYNVLKGSSTVEINKADINPEDITVIPYSGEYDGENHSIAVVDANGGTITYSTSETGEYTTENPAYKNIGSFTVYYKVDRGTNYNVLSGSSIVEISKINIAIEDITVTPYSGEYDGANHSITVVDTNGGTVTYSTNETGEYTTENPAYKNVGSYTVYYKVDRGASYNVLNGSSTVKITKTDIDSEDITVTPYSGEYDGENHSIAVVDANGGTVTYSTSETGEYTTENPAYKKVGSYTTYYKVDRGTNYNVLKGSSTVEITKADIDAEDITVTPYSGEYDGENHSITVVDTNGGTVTYSTSETGDYTTENPVYKKAGSYTVYYKVDRGENYNILKGSSTVEISKLNIATEDITVTPYSDEYDGENHSITVVDTNGGTVTYSTNETGEYTTENPTYKNVGSYTVYYKVDRGANYNVLSGSSTVEITKTDIATEDITVTPYSDEYDGENHSITVVDTNGGTVTYSTNETGEYTTENPTYKNVGSYTVYYKVDRGTNYNVLSGSSTVEMDFREVTLKGITITDKTYDGTTDATSNVTGAYLDGVIEGDDIVLDSSNMIAMFNDEKVNNDKSVTISGYVLSGLSASQYNLLQPKNITGNIIAETSFDMNISIDQVVTAEETDYDGEWTSSDVIITLSGDAPSGIEKYQYTTDGGSSWVDITDSSLLINDTTDKAYAFRAISNGGMNSDSSNIIVVKIDKTKPTIQSVQGNPTTPRNTPQIITFEVFEENSGIDLNTLTVSKDGTNIEIKNENGKYSFIADVNGKYDINVSDNVGNAADMEVVEVNKLDFEKPIISSLVPANNAQPVDGGLLTAIFNEDVMKSKDGIGGDITIFNSNGEVFERIDIKNNRIKVSEKQVNIYLTKPLRFGVEYYVTIDSDIICDIAGNNFTGIADSNIWRFKTSNTNNNSIIGINLLVMGEQYKAIVDPSDETVYSVIAKPNVDGKVKVKVTPVFLIDAKSVITTENEGVEINGDTVTITDIDKETANVKIQIKNADGSIDENKIYTLIIHRGSLETKVTKSGISVDVDADNLRGAVDVSSDISDGKQMELELGIADNGNSISESQKLEIENFLRGRSVAMYLDVDLKLKNITNNTETLIENTQNPIKIKIEIPENMRGGRNYKIIRVHNGVIEILDTVLEGNYLIFETDRFSQYAISYTPDKDDDDTYVKNNQNESLEKHMSYIKGYEDTTFRPENNITRAEAATIIARLSSAYDEHKYYINIYGDVDVQAWYANTVSFGAQNKFILGYEDGSFRPDASITRAELVSIIARFNNVDSKGESELQFADVSGHWASGTISALYKLGWINGYEDGSFRPDAAITRAEAVKIINASLGRTPIKERVDLNISKYFVRFTDISDSNWAYYDILESSITHTAIDFN